MSKIKKEILEAKVLSIQVYTEDFKNEYISFTDIARYKTADCPSKVVRNLIRNRELLNYLVFRDR